MMNIHRLSQIRLSYGLLLIPITDLPAKLPYPGPLKNQNLYKTIQIARLSHHLDSCLEEIPNWLHIPQKMKESEQKKEQPKKKPQLAPGTLELFELRRAA